MALEKEGYIPVQRGTTRQKVGVNDNGDLVLDGEYTKSAKFININQVNADNSLKDNVEVFNKFMSFLGITASDPLSNQMTVKWEVA